LVGDHAAAEQHLRFLLALNQRLHGAAHVDVARSMHNLAFELTSQGQYEQAESFFRRALAMRQELLGASDPAVADSLHGLAVVLSEQGKSGESEVMERRALLIQQKWPGTENPEHAESPKSEAPALDNQERAVAAGRDAADALFRQGRVLQDQGKYKQAEQLYRQALAMDQKRVGPVHLDVAASLNNLAYVLYREGEYAQAEQLYRQALAMNQKLLGVEHLAVATNLNNLGEVLLNEGKDEQAAGLLGQSLKIRKKLLGAEHPDVAQSLCNLAAALGHMGHYEEAVQLARQALRMREKLLGAEHPGVAASLGTLADALSGQGHYRESELLMREALQMNQQRLGNEHPDIAVGLASLADALQSQGKYAEAEPIYRQVLALYQKRLGTEHPRVSGILRNLATLLMSRDQFQVALPLFVQSAQIEEKLLRATFSETRMRAALDLVRGEEEAVYGLLLEHPDSAELQRLAMTTALLRKGRAAEAGTTANRLLHRSRSNRGQKERFVRWQELREQREALLFGSPPLSPADYRDRLSELGREADDLESQLAAEMPELRNLQPPDFDAVLSAVSARLPRGAVLIEVVFVQPFLFKSRTTNWGTPHYIAMVLSAEKTITVRDLGDAKTVDAQVRALLAALRNPKLDPREPAQALYQQILRPLLPDGAAQVYLSVDGALNLIPFTALHDGTDYLLDRRDFHYLTSGRDLLQTDSDRAAQPALVLADPDFGNTAPTQSAAESKTFYQLLSTLQPLPGARGEATLVGRLLSVPPILGPKAKESAVRAAHAPWVLHIATHGLFLNNRELSHDQAREEALPRNQVKERKGVLFDHFATEELTMSGDANSLSRSALVLAGAAQGGHAKTTAEDGLLTSEEARSLDLFGTQLVVLSACETGQGELSAGQGVYGLRRAFLVAGAETVVTSLWQVNDAATGKLMELYYRRLLKQKQGRLQGMQEAMKEMRAKYAHPYYWAPFLVIGSDGPLRPPVGVLH
jgi:CHAT domain-containing protein/Tfp pilus assembly protein PilF